MKHAPLSETAEAISSALTSANASSPDPSGGEPYWFHDLCARAALILGKDAIQFASHSFTDRTDQDGEAWIFSAKVVVRATYRGDMRKGELKVQAFGRRELRSLDIAALDEPNDAGLERPDAELTYRDVTVRLPLGVGVKNLPNFRDFLFSLAADLDCQRSPLI